MTTTPILLSAGEASGDMYAARLAAALQQRSSIALFGMGGPKMAAAGVELVVNSSEVAVVGITEIIHRLPSLLRAMRRLVAEAERRQPPLAIFVDFPSFHLRLARKLRRVGIRNIYFVAPQFWAWRPWRVRPMRRRFEQALCIFPFEEEFFRQRGMPAKFVGHPLVGKVRAKKSRACAPPFRGRVCPRCRRRQNSVSRGDDCRCPQSDGDPDRFHRFLNMKKPHD